MFCICILLVHVNSSNAQMFENWVWDARMLGALGRHYQTGEPLPAPLLENLVRSRVANAALVNLRQITLARLDLDLHHNIALGKGVEQELEFDSAQTYTKLSVELSRTRVTPNTNMAGSFTHMARGYDSQYYGYEDSFGVHVLLYFIHVKSNP